MIVTSKVLVFADECCLCEQLTRCWVTRRSAGSMISLVTARLTVPPLSMETFTIFSVLTTSLTMTIHFSLTAEEVDTSQEALHSVLKTLICRRSTLTTLTASTDSIRRISTEMLASSTTSFMSVISRCTARLTMQHVREVPHFITSHQVFIVSD